MKWIRQKASDLFLVWHQRRLRQLELDEQAANAERTLRGLQRTLEMIDRAANTNSPSKPVPFDRDRPSDR